MPVPSEFPKPPSGRDRREPELAHDASYLAASARIRSLFSSSKTLPLMDVVRNQSVSANGVRQEGALHLFGPPDAPPLLGKIMAKSTRCWPGYQPVPGKKNSQGSCRPKPESKLTAEEKKFRTKRKKQLHQWKVQHPGAPKRAAQHLGAPTAGKSRKKKTTQKAS